MPSEEIKPFKIDNPTQDVDRMLRKIKDTQQPVEDVVPSAGQDYGVPTAWFRDLLSYWQTTYSWPEAQTTMNTKFSHFTTTIEDINIHFIHQRSSHADAKPLLLLHGWPGSFHEFSEVIPSLCEEGGTTPSFHCIAPSLPGFCFSSSPPRKGWTVKDTARIFHTLMLRLGYPQYAVQAGDWGQFVARELGANPAYGCQVLHLNYCPGALPEELSDDDLTDREKRARAAGIDWRTNHVGYAVLMRTRPQTLGWMLQDNPIGLLAFVGEKYHEASNPRVHDDAQWRDHILTTVCLYYFTHCITSSALIYYENTPHHLFATYAMEDENRIRCPFGYSSYMFDTAPNSKRAVERTGNLVLYRERDYAGHFACLEDAQGVAEDVRELVSKHWPR